MMKRTALLGLFATASATSHGLRGNHVDAVDSYDTVGPYQEILQGIHASDNKVELVEPVEESKKSEQVEEDEDPYAINMFDGSDKVESSTASPTTESPDSATTATTDFYTPSDDVEEETESDYLEPTDANMAEGFEHVEDFEIDGAETGTGEDMSEGTDKEDADAISGMTPPISGITDELPLEKVTEEQMVEAAHGLNLLSPDEIDAGATPGITPPILGITDEPLEQVTEAQMINAAHELNMIGSDETETDQATEPKFAEQDEALDTLKELKDEADEIKSIVAALKMSDDDRKMKEDVQKSETDAINYQGNGHGVEDK